MKAIANFLSGAILFFVGIWMLLSNIRVTDIRFLYLSGVNTAPILIVLFVVLIVLAIVNSNKWLWGGCTGCNHHDCVCDSWDEIFLCKNERTGFALDVGNTGGW